MTATVIEETEVSFWSLDALNTLLRRRRDFCDQMLTILGQKMAESQALAKSLAYGDKQPAQASRVVWHSALHLKKFFRRSIDDGQGPERKAKREARQLVWIIWKTFSQSLDQLVSHVDEEVAAN